MKLYRYRFITAGFIILVFLMVGVIGAALAQKKTAFVEAYNRANLIRLHIVANSDSKADQAVKLKVRDRILKTMEPLILKVENPKQARAVVSQNLKVIQREATEELLQNGQKMKVAVSFGKYQFPERSYPFGVLPAGTYQGVRVILGEGRGHNWWCCLYPALCLLEPNAPTFKGTNSKQPAKVEYRLAVLEKLVQKKGLSMDSFWRGWGKYFRLF
ncbi:MAG TPA: stage II sporulation protein R [Bacillota bacterium]|nr:stage II sporulation protein R [Bacillota bacterium]